MYQNSVEKIEKKQTNNIFTFKNCTEQNHFFLITLKKLKPLDTGKNNRKNCSKYRTYLYKYRKKSITMMSAALAGLAILEERKS